jgi:adenylate kinase
MKCIVLLAPPAAGKGTIARYIQDKYNYRQISTGDLLREEAKANEEIRNLMNEGYLKAAEAVEVYLKEGLNAVRAFVGRK